MVIHIPDEYIVDVLKSCTEEELIAIQELYTTKSAKEKLDNRAISVACAYALQRITLEGIEHLRELGDVYIT